MGIGNTLVALKTHQEAIFSNKVYSVPGQTEGRRKTFLEWKSMDLSSKLPLKCWGNVNYHKSAHHPIPTLPGAIGNKHTGCFQSKSVSSPFNWVPRCITFLAKLERRRRPFLEGTRRWVTLWDYTQEHLFVIRDKKISSFVKFEIILPHLCFLLDPLYK